MLLGLNFLNGCRAFFDENSVAAIETADTCIFIIDVNFSFAVGTIVRQISHLFQFSKIGFSFQECSEMLCVPALRRSKEKKKQKRPSHSLCSFTLQILLPLRPGNRSGISWSCPEAHFSLCFGMFFRPRFEEYMCRRQI